MASEFVHDIVESSNPRLYTPPELAWDKVAMLCKIGDGAGLIRIKIHKTVFKFTDNQFYSIPIKIISCIN